MYLALKKIPTHGKRFNIKINTNSWHIKISLVNVFDDKFMVGFDYTHLVR
jgi:hypothetical protein